MSCLPKTTHKDISEEEILARTPPSAAAVEFITTGRIEQLSAVVPQEVHTGPPYAVIVPTKQLIFSAAIQVELRYIVGAVGQQAGDAVFVKNVVVAGKKGRAPGWSDGPAPSSRRSLYRPAVSGRKGALHPQ